MEEVPKPNEAVHAYLARTRSQEILAANHAEAQRTCEQTHGIFVIDRAPNGPWPVDLLKQWIGESFTFDAGDLRMVKTTAQGLPSIKPMLEVPALFALNRLRMSNDSYKQEAARAFYALATIQRWNEQSRLSFNISAGTVVDLRAHEKVQIGSLENNFKVTRSPVDAELADRLGLSTS